MPKLKFFKLLKLSKLLKFNKIIKIYASFAKQKPTNTILDLSNTLQKIL